jgi:membrane protease YdiL (CAAX protease family)
MRARAFLYLSILLIVAYWVFSAAKLLSAAGQPYFPDSVRVLALYAGVRAVVVLALVWSLLRGGGERLAGLGLGARAVKLALVRGLLLAVGIFVLEHAVANGVRALLGGGMGTAPAVVALFRDPREAPYWVFAAVVGGGFTEELQRAFVLTRFERAFGKLGLTVALLVDSASFGVGHLYQGPSAAVTTALTGLLFGLVFLQRRRVADAMVAHAGFDLIGVAAAYALYARAG